MMKTGEREGLDDERLMNLDPHVEGENKSHDQDRLYWSGGADDDDADVLIDRVGRLGVAVLERKGRVFAVGFVFEGNGTVRVIKHCQAPRFWEVRLLALTAN
eukprot:3933652-Rhodomonas_salina.1